MSDAPRFPHALDVERLLVGGVCMSPEMLPAVRAVVQGEDFYRPDHRELYTLVCAMADAGERVDLTTVAFRVAAGGDDQRYGGVGYVLRLMEDSAPAAALHHYASVVHETARARRLMAAAQKAGRDLEAGEPIENVIAELSGQLAEASGSAPADEWSTLEEEAYAVVGDLSDPDAVEVIGADVPFDTMTSVLPRFPAGEITVIAARPGIGKSTFARQAAHGIACTGGSVLVFSLEMSPRQIASAMLASEVGGSAAEVIALAAKERERWRDYERAAADLRGLPILLHRRSTHTVTSIAAAVRAKQLQLEKAGAEPLRAVVVDHLGLLSGADVDPKGRMILSQRIGEQTAALKRLAVDLQITVLLLCQLNRAIEQRADATPKLSDLRDSGAIEQDAAVVMFLHRDMQGADRGLAIASVPKNRYGPTGVIELGWDDQRGRFANDRVIASVA